MTAFGVREHISDRGSIPTSFGRTFSSIYIADTKSGNLPKKIRPIACTPRTVTPSIGLSGIYPPERRHHNFSDARNDTSVQNDNIPSPKLVATPFINNDSESDQPKYIPMPNAEQRKSSRIRRPPTWLSDYNID